MNNFHELAEGNECLILAQSIAPPKRLMSNYHESASIRGRLMNNDRESAEGNECLICSLRSHPKDINAKFSTYGIF